MKLRLAAAFALLATPALAWDSAQFEWLTPIIHPTHSYLTEYAIDQLRERLPGARHRTATSSSRAPTPSFTSCRSKASKYGIDLEAKRREHKGTNAGSDDVDGWWDDALAAHAAGNEEQAYFYLGVVLHMIEDMGVPAHANGIYHQGNISEFDNFEAMALQRWDPDFSSVDRADPGYDNPADYYAVSQDWAAADAPGLSRHGQLLEDLAHRQRRGRRPRPQAAGEHRDRRHVGAATRDEGLRLTTTPGRSCRAAPPIHARRARRRCRGRTT